MIQNDCMIAGAKPGGSDSERFVDNGFLCKYTRLYSLFFFLSLQGIWMAEKGDDCACRLPKK